MNIVFAFCRRFFMSRLLYDATKQSLECQLTDRARLSYHFPADGARITALMSLKEPTARPVEQPSAILVDTCSRRRNFDGTSSTRRNIHTCRTHNESDPGALRAAQPEAHSRTSPRIELTTLTRAQTTMATEMTREKLETLVNSVEALEENVNKLHDALEKKGVNSRGTKDIFGRVFSMPVRVTAPAAMAAQTQA
tara:strand:- start:244 stop:828 length:585 start_codon:yes stop_codon:yes gene_type:complete